MQRAVEWGPNGVSMLYRPGVRTPASLYGAVRPVVMLSYSCMNTGQVARYGFADFCQFFLYFLISSYSFILTLLFALHPSLIRHLLVSSHLTL